MDKWLETMHRQPLIRLQSGAAAHVTDFNDRLKQELELIGAKHSGFTLHAIRNQDIAEAHEDPNMRNDSISLGVGHSSCHTNNYKGWVLLLVFSNRLPRASQLFSKCCCRVHPNRSPSVPLSFAGAWIRP